jgi:cytochrome c
VNILTGVRIFRAAACLLGFGLASICLVAQADDMQKLAQRVTKSHCAGCHTFGEGEPRGQGPNIYGLIGREAGIEAGFPYSEDFMKALGGKIWTVELLDKWLIDSQVVAPGNGMTYFQDDEAIRQLIIDCLDNSCAAD